MFIFSDQRHHLKNKELGEWEWGRRGAGAEEAEELTFHVMWKSHEKPNPLTPFPTSVGGKFKVSLLKGREK
jgi:hypothetical protein